MSSPILPMKGPLDLSTSTSSADGGLDDISALVSELTATEATLVPVASRGAPPMEVLDQIAAARRIYDRLRERGHQLSFLVGASGEPTSIELRDREGNLVKRLSTVEAFELAAGRPLG
jgi:hypothetical protein